MVVAASAPPLFEELAILVVAGAIIAYLSARVGTVPIIGFLVSGAIIGPNGLALIDDLELVNQSADIGIVLLLFTIGIEFSLDRLRQLAALILGGGAIQVGLSTVVVTGALLIGDVEWRTAVFTGLLVSLSSTAIVLKMLSDRRTTTTPSGRVAVSFLIFQDLAVVAMVLLVPTLGGETTGALDVIWALAKAVGIVVAVLIVARTLTPWLLDVVARTCSAEIFLLTVVGLCFGTAYLTSLLDVSISLGAFLAGLMVSESRLSARALGDVLPLQILFSATFFVSVGMLLDVEYVLDNLGLVLGAAAAIVVIKLITTGVAAAVLGRPRSVVVGSAIILAQVGEFSFVLQRSGEEVGLSPAGLDDGSEAFIAVTVLLMVLSPFAIRLAEVVTRRLEPSDNAPRTVIQADTPVHGSNELVDHVVVSGYSNRSAQIVNALDLADLDHVIVTLDPDVGRQVEEQGRRVIQGDLARQFIAERAGLAFARLVVIADDEIERIVQVASIVHSLNPDAVVLARVDTVAEAAEIQGVDSIDHVVAEEGAAVDALIGHALGVYALPERLVEVITQSTLGTIEETDEDSLIDVDHVVHTDLAGDGCEHIDEVRAVRPSAPGCERCLAEGTRWVHLRICLTCGFVGCCDSSQGRHATGHFHETGHPVIRSVEPDEDWAWCYVDRVTLDVIDTDPVAT